MRSLKLTDMIYLILDRETDTQPIFANKGDAKTAVIVFTQTNFSENLQKEYI